MSKAPLPGCCYLQHRVYNYLAVDKVVIMSLSCTSELTTHALLVTQSAA